MIDKATEKSILDALAEDYDILDVYFHKGKLYVVNGYDVEAVERFVFGIVEVVAVDSVEGDYYGA